jgi:starvation-inducible DNA-binding protein
VSGEGQHHDLVECGSRRYRGWTGKIWLWRLVLLPERNPVALGDRVAEAGFGFVRLRRRLPRNSDYPAATKTHGIPKELQLRKPAMFATKNDLSEEIRTKAIELLNARLADAIDLATQIKQAHWNVKGANFIALHELFDKINEDVQDYVDDIAERAVQLGGIAEGTARMAAKRSTLSEYPTKTVDGPDHVEALSSVLAAFGKLARAAIDSANDLGDLDTADLFTEISRVIDKWLWFVEAHQQAER